MDRDGCGMLYTFCTLNVQRSIKFAVSGQSRMVATKTEDKRMRELENFVSSCGLYLNQEQEQEQEYCSLSSHGNDLIDQW